MQPESESPSARLQALARRFFDDWMAAEPEEATTLGLADPDGRLRDPSPGAAEAQGRAARAVLAELDAIEGDAAAHTLDREERRDAWAIRAHATERARAAERGAAETSLEAVPYAIMMLAHAAARADSDALRATVTRRVRALPAYVASARAALEAGMRHGRPFAQSVIGKITGALASAPADLAQIVTTAFASAPGDGAAAARALEAAERAAQSVLAFAAFLREDVAASPGALDVVCLGEDEYERRLRAWWELGGCSDVARRARAELALAQARAVELAAELAPSGSAPSAVRTFQDAKVVLDALLAPKPATADAILPMYEREIERATSFCRERRLFDIPAICRCEVRPAPELWRRFSVCTNWPAPLLGGDAPGACAVLLDPALHPLVGVPGLAVHEAVPGHFLQSRAWQLGFGGTKAPVRFLSVPDECGVLRDTWVPHFMIEGWAVFAEARMEEAGFYPSASRLFHFVCRAIHAARALADMGLHVEGWSRSEVGAFLCDATGMPPAFGESQAARYAESGLQAHGYLIGALAIEELRTAARTRLGARYDELAFQAELLAAGPVPPACAART